MLQRLSKGDAGAFEVLYKAHWENLFNTAYKRLKNEELCKDVVQDVFADLWLRKKDVTINNLAAYLHTAVRFQVLKQINRRGITDVFYDPLDAVIISSLDADGRLLEKDLVRIITEWMEELPAKRREIFRLHFELEHTTREIATQLNISQKTVQNQLGNAVQSLHAHIALQLLLLVAVNAAN